MPPTVGALVFNLQDRRFYVYAQCGVWLRVVRFNVPIDTFGPITVRLG